MALDPSIPLGVKPMAAPAAMDPFETIGKWAQIQNALNQNRLFQQTFQARQRAGQIMATAPDLETGLQSLLRDPVTAPFAGETVNNIRQAQNTLVDLQGKIQTQSDTGLTAFVKTMGLVYADPTEDTWNNAAQATLSTLSPEAQKRVAPAINSLKKALIDGLPEDPAARRAVFNQRAAGLWLAGGGTPEGIAALAGKNETLDLNNSLQPGVRAPAQLGGGFFPSGPAYAKGLPPGFTAGPGGVPIPVGGANNLLGPVQADGQQPGAPTTASAPAPSNALGGAQAPIEVKPLPAPPARSGPVPPAGQTGPNAGAAQAPTRVPQTTAGDGKPLFDLSIPMRSPTSGSGLGGMQLLSPTQLKQSENLQNEFSGKGLEEYNNAVQSLASLRYMDNALDEMQKAGGILTPGAFAQARLKIAQSWNTLAQSLGVDDKYKFDPATIASAEDFNKETKRMGLMVLTTFLGAQREAAQTIQGITASVPGIENTYLGGKLVSEGIKGAMQRVVDRRQFMTEWGNQNSANLTGAAEAFDRQHPASDYAERVLKQFGLSDGGFDSPQAVRDAFSKGYLTRDKAAEILAKQFPDQFKKR